MMEFEDTDIYQAILDNNIQLLQQLLQTENVNCRGYDGSSYLHVAIDQGAHNSIITLLLHKIDLSHRDENGDTALDLAIMRQATHLQWLILQHFRHLVMEGDKQTLDHLLQQGWDAWPVDVEDVKEVRKDIQIFFSDLPTIQKKIFQVHHCIEQNSQKYLKNTLTSHLLAVARDHSGLPPLQKAVIFQHNAIAEYIINNFPTTINAVDNMGRTALHYSACSTNDDICAILKKAGADEMKKDLTGTTPKIFQNNPGLFSLKDVQQHLKARQRSHASGLAFHLLTLDIVQPTEDKSLILLTHQRPSMSNLPTYINITRKKSLSPQLSESSCKDALEDSDPVDLMSSPHKHSVNIHDDRSECKLFEETKLYEAVVMNDAAFVEYLLKNEEDTNLRSLEGWSYLHLAVSHNADLIILQQLIKKLDISIHDVDGKTALDLLVVQPHKLKTIELFQKEILGYLARGEITRLKRLALNGWPLWPPCDEMNIKMIAAEPLKLFLQNIRHVQETVQELHQSALVDDVKTLKSTLREYSKSMSSIHVLDNNEIIRACDKSGIPLFIKTVIFNSNKCFIYLLETYPQIVGCLDNMERTALHYWTNVDDVMYNKLIESGVDKTCYDLWGMPATEYQRNPHLLGMDALIMRLGESKRHSEKEVYNLPWSHYLMLLLNMQMEQSEIYKAIRANDLDAVKDCMETCDFGIRDSEGHSLLHLAVLENDNIEIFKLLLEKVDIGIRDVYGNTVSDTITQEVYANEAKEEIKKYIVKLAEEDNIDKLTSLLLSGWNDWPFTVSEAKEISEDFGNFLENLEVQQIKIKNIHKAIDDGRTRDVKSLLDRKLLAVATDQTGMPPLQKAVLFNHVGIIEFIVSEFPDTVNLTDNMLRTALHYAGAFPDNGVLYNMLIEGKADERIEDLMGKTPSDYLENPEDLALDTIKQKIVEMLENAKKKEEELLALNSVKQKIKEEPKPMDPEDFTIEPVQMYIAGDIYAKRNVPPPTSVDGKYIAKNVGSALTMALAEIAERRPWDPIEYLAQWLYKYKETLDYNQRQVDLLIQIRKDEVDLIEEGKMKLRRQEEQRLVQEREEIKRKKREEEERIRKEEEEAEARAIAEALAKGSLLSTVAEEEEEELENMLKDRDESGRTELHKLASAQGADLVALIDMNYSLADRDGNNKTARDIAEEFAIEDNMESIDGYISNLIEQEKLETIQQLLLDGYDKLNIVLEHVSTDGLPAEVTEFIAALPKFQEKIASVFQVVHRGLVRDVAQVLDRKKLVLVKDVYGRSPLHIAVLRENKALVKYIAKHYPISTKCRDNLNRTPLHYAMAISDELVELILKYRADPEAIDVKQRTPAYYKEEKDDILKLKETLPAIEPISPKAEKTENTTVNVTPDNEPVAVTSTPSLSSQQEDDTNAPTTETDD